MLEKIKIERTLYIENELREKFKDKPEKWIKDKVKNEVDKFDNLIKKTSILNNNLWINIPLEAITTLLGDGLHGTPKYVESSEYYFINGNNLQQGKIVIKSDTKFVSQEEYLKYKKNMNNNTILVSINGTLGNVAFYDNEQVMLGKSACYFNLINSINKYYIFWKINSQDFREYADKSATGSTIKNLPLSAMRNYKLPICSILEQQEIVNQIKKHFSIIDKLETVVQQSIKESKRLRQSILKQAFEGKLVEQNPNDKSASVLLEKIAKAKEEYQKAQKKQVRKK
nr:restriction endonuclease subunit S [Aliarcobacter butzleri]